MTNVLTFPSEDTLQQRISRVVNTLMHERQLKRYTLAEALGIDPSVVSTKMKPNGGNRWSPEDILNLARFFELPVGYFYGEDGDTPPTTPSGTLVGRAGLEPATKGLAVCGHDDLALIAYLPSAA